MLLESRIMLKYYARNDVSLLTGGWRPQVVEVQRSRRCVALRHLMLSSSCHRIVLATAPGVPTPQHRFSDPQKLAAGFQLAFSRTGPKTVSCSPLPVVRFGGEHNVLSLHTHHRSSQDCTCRPAVAISTVLGRTQLPTRARSTVPVRMPVRESPLLIICAATI